MPTNLVYAQPPTPVPKATSMSTLPRSPEAAVARPQMGRREWLLLLLLAGVWSSSFLFFAVALAELPPLTVVLGRVGLAAPVLLVVLVATGHRLPADWRSWQRFFAINVMSGVSESAHASTLAPFSSICATSNGTAGLAVSPSGDHRSERCVLPLAPRRSWHCSC